MTTYSLQPEVPGALGEGAILDRSTHPPTVSHLSVEFDDWLGDDLVEGFPAFLVTQRLSDSLTASGLTGFRIAGVHVTTSPEFDDWHPGPLPRFNWLQVVGVPGRDDFSVGDTYSLTVIEGALVLLREFTLDHCRVTELP